jgi:hypothetical protein
MGPAESPSAPTAGALAPATPPLRALPRDPGRQARPELSSPACARPLPGGHGLPLAWLGEGKSCGGGGLACGRAQGATCPFPHFGAWPLGRTRGGWANPA